MSRSRPIGAISKFLVAKTLEVSPLLNFKLVSLATREDSRAYSLVVMFNFQTPFHATSIVYFDGKDFLECETSLIAEGILPEKYFLVNVS